MPERVHVQTIEGTLGSESPLQLWRDTALRHAQMRESVSVNGNGAGIMDNRLPMKNRG